VWVCVKGKKSGDGRSGSRGASRDRSHGVSIEHECLVFVIVDYYHRLSRPCMSMSNKQDFVNAS
jgi:hypothetical protein